MPYCNNKIVVVEVVLIVVGVALPSATAVVWCAVCYTVIVVSCLFVGRACYVVAFCVRILCLRSGNTEPKNT